MTGAESSSGRHRRAASNLGPIDVGVVTVSDTRTPDSDENGAWLGEQIEAVGHRLAGYEVVPDEPAEVVRALEDLVADGCRVVLLNGGTGISGRDGTFEAVSGVLEKVLPGFGELFRVLSFEQVGSAAMLSRAVAGVYDGAVVFSVPGSPAAVRLAWERLIAPELEHLVWELER